MIELKLDEITGIARVEGLEEEITADFQLLQNPGRPAASRRQGQAGEFPQPLRMVAEKFVKDAISVHLSIIILG
jgi:hypothetical protein